MFIASINDLSDASQDGNARATFANFTSMNFQRPFAAACDTGERVFENVCLPYITWEVHLERREDAVTRDTDLIQYNNLARITQLPMEWAPGRPRPLA